MKLALAVAPQRSTLYGNLARFLAVPELLASPVMGRLRGWERQQLAGQDWLILDCDEEFGEAELTLLWRLGTVAAVYEYFSELGGQEGPFLRPLPPRDLPYVPVEMIETRRYRGKTNELFTTVLLNLALFASDYAEQTAEPLRILDPLMGGATTLFVALVRGYSAVGIEQEKGHFDTTNAFVQQFFTSMRYPSKRMEERVRGAGRRALFNVGRKEDSRLLGLIQGDTYDTPTLVGGLPGGARFHAVVTDLPYGVQHQGQVLRLLNEAVPRWASVLLPGGAIALAWDANGPRRAEALAVIARHPQLRALDEPPYNQLDHPVDRQIKHRDVLVIRKEG